MQIVTPWPSDFDVSEPVARVIVDGQEVDVESVEVTAELGSAMPERVAAAGGGVVAATGSATIVPASDVTDAGFNPWGDTRRLVNASEVVVEAGFRDPSTGGVGCARQITGQVESLDGGALSNSVGLDFVDHTTLLDRDITIEPLIPALPSLGDWGALRGVGLYPVYITDRVLRYCGFYATPPMITGALLSAPLMGSAIPERGTVLSAWAESSTSSYALFQWAPWGMGLGNAVIRYEPNRGASSGMLTTTMHVSFLRRASTSSSPGDGRIELRYGSNNDGVLIHPMGDGRIVVRYRHGSTTTTVATLPAADGNASETFSVIITPSGQATIYASNGASASGTATLPPASTSNRLEEVYVVAPQSGHIIGGLQVAATSATNHLYERTAHIGPPDHFHMLRAFPSQINVNCLSLLKQQSEAELAAMWIDEFGHFHWRARGRLQAGLLRGTLTSQENLLDLPWSVPVRSVYSRVEVEHETPTLTLRGVPNITVSDNRGSTLTNGETEDRFFEPPADQDWHGVQAPVGVSAAGNVDNTQLKRGRGSYRGGVLLAGDDDNVGEIARSANLTQSWHQINPQRWLLRSTVQGLAGGEFVEQRFMDWPGPYGRFRGEDLPLVRAKGLVQWESQTTAGTARGPALAPVYVHKVGHWLQGEDALVELADWLANELTKPDVVLRDVPIVPDPRLQLGDVFYLQDNTTYQVRLRVLIMGKTLRAQASDNGYEMSQRITCRVLDVERLKVRYEELENEWDGRDYAEFESVWSGTNYSALEADPLDRS